MQHPSPLRNRCAPDGSLHAVAVRGLMMGNRGGRLHRPDGTLGAARWRGRGWIACLTDFRGRRRAVWGDGYTEIFFLDEATALSAGHRPCFECRRAEAREFAAAWGRATGMAAPAAPEIDRRLHAERTATPERRAIAALPAGSIYADDGGFHLRTEAGARRWGFAGYGAERAVDPGTEVTALTPPSSRAALAAGYQPRLHPSAGRQFNAR